MIDRFEIIIQRHGSKTKAFLNRRIFSEDEAKKSSAAWRGVYPEDHIYYQKASDA